MSATGRPERLRTQVSRSAQREATLTSARHGTERECLTLSATGRASARTAAAHECILPSATGGPSARNADVRSAKAFT